MISPNWGQFMALHIERFVSKGSQCKLNWNSYVSKITIYKPAVRLTSMEVTFASLRRHCPRTSGLKNSSLYFRAEYEHTMPLRVQRMPKSIWLSAKRFPKHYALAHWHQWRGLPLSRETFFLYFIQCYKSDVLIKHLISKYEAANNMPPIWWVNPQTLLCRKFI